jgi:hypothetical protein
MDGFRVSDNTSIEGQQSFASRSPNYTSWVVLRLAHQPMGDAYPKGCSVQKHLRGCCLTGDE